MRASLSFQYDAARHLGETVVSLHDITGHKDREADLAAPADIDHVRGQRDG